MKFLEELLCGNTFLLNSNAYILTTDFKKNGSRLCVCLKDGSTRWLEGNTVIEAIQIYRLDKENNIIPFQETPKDDIP